ncbi:hypothetical protein GCM10010970_31130 [Silvimonas iriomotensis]|uniref:Uncharacterized protein n=1 Tax=Silvimonas iriomotensis TaxID=449662 RepID=A0ABQ2PC53_9NEIS|nr:hypothetical protein GCM10010970_31130 [Silvimonas iriomotensis]
MHGTARHKRGDQQNAEKSDYIEFKGKGWQKIQVLHARLHGWIRAGLATRIPGWRSAGRNEESGCRPDSVVRSGKANGPLRVGLKLYD